MLITNTCTTDPLLTSRLNATGLPVHHLEARRTWKPDQLAYMSREGIGNWYQRGLLRSYGVSREKASSL